MKEPGILLISLDFELFWGVRDCIPEGQCRERIEMVHTVIPRLVDLFELFDIHASFATVGMLMVRDFEELLRYSPINKPEYLDKNLSPYNGYLKNINGQNTNLHFAPALVQRIAQSPGLEISSHTFSHYYCLAEGQGAAEFEQDLQAHIRLGSDQGIELKTLVFPRNQYNRQYLEICRKNGIRAFRGNESSWLYSARDDKQETSLRRAFRLADAYINLSGHHTYGQNCIKRQIPLNFPSSRFLRPVNPRNKWLEELRLRRITSAMDYAAMHGEIYHLWWHPHNFGENTDANFEFLEKILCHYRQLNRQYEFKSYNMAELAEHLEAVPECV